MAKTETDTRNRNLQRHGDLDPAQWDEAATVTGRSNDLVEGKVKNTTFGDRAKANTPEPAPVEDDAKAVSSVTAQNKAVSTGKTARK